MFSESRDHVMLECSSQSFYAMSAQVTPCSVALLVGHTRTLTYGSSTRGKVALQHVLSRMFRICEE